MFGVYECAATRRHLDRIEADEKRRADAVDCLRDSFLEFTRPCNPRAIALFAPCVTAWVAGKPDGKRNPHFWEVLHDSLEAKDFAERAMKVLMEAAAGRVNQADAQELLQEMAAHWADSHADEVL